eukprot:COSAG01_NODE_31348_length_599_cov_0.978000_1_plen_23_part_10
MAVAWTTGAVTPPAAVTAAVTVA